MSIGFLIEDNSPVIWRGPMASGAIKQFMADVEWGELDYLIFDMPSWHWRYSTYSCSNHSS
jgi:ATP-binding protein involved in chromosome partitioning